MHQVDNLTIYYAPKKVDDQFVLKLGNYFKKNDLILSHPHSVQLTSDPNGYILKMVLDPKYKVIPADQAGNFLALEQDLRVAVFDSLNFRIEVCNQNFIPLENQPN